MYYSIDGGLNWIRLGNAPAVPWLDMVSSDDGMTLVATSVVSNIWVSIDGGITWNLEASIPNTIEVKPTMTADGLSYTIAYTDPTDPNGAYTQTVSYMFRNKTRRQSKGTILDCRLNFICCLLFLRHLPLFIYSVTEL